MRRFLQMQWFWGMHGLVLETSIWLLAESTRSQLIFCCILLLNESKFFSSCEHPNLKTNYTIFVLRKIKVKHTQPPKDPARSAQFVMKFHDDLCKILMVLEVRQGSLFSVKKMAWPSDTFSTKHHSIEAVVFWRGFSTIHSQRGTCKIERELGTARTVFFTRKIFW